MYGRGVIEAVSAGTGPESCINLTAIKVLAGLGYDLTQHTPKTAIFEI